VPEDQSPATLVLGGARSGKSRYAEAIVTALPGPWAYIATAQGLDEEMRVRIATHRRRRGSGWTTIEEPLELCNALELAGSRPALVDCLTLWLSNLLLEGRDLERAMRALDRALEMRTAPTVLVANEVGLGIVPDNALARMFRDAAGRLNQLVAARASSVMFLVAGLPMRVK
jgi:adenosylcobinamide kinase/adenosylcobinamide-phosphate guanylyltransferase